MKRLFLFTMMCLFGLFGSLNAQTNIELNVGLEGSVSSVKNLPTYSYYNYSISQQIYTAAEMQDLSGTISSLAFRQTSAGEFTRNLSVYLLNVDASTFASNKGWIPVSEADLVFSGNVATPNAAGAWMNIDFQTPFEYTGGNLLVCVADNTGSYKSGLAFDVYSHGNGMQTLFAYRDGSAYDIANPNVATSEIVLHKNVVKFNIAIDGEYKAITIKPKNIELGARPNGAWMRPYEVTIGTRGNNLNIVTLETTNSYFQLPELELPTDISMGSPLLVNFTHGEAEGDVNGQLVVFYGETRSLEMVDMTAFAYNPVASDVWETAEAITSYPFTATPDMATTYDN